LNEEEMTAKVILNPYAGRWKAKEHKSDVISALNEFGIEFELIETSSPGDGINLAHDAVLAGFNPIIVAGGDGSISEVVNGMMLASNKGGKLPPLGIMPLGSANDLVVNLGLPVELTAAAQVISTRLVKKIDLGIVNSRYFDNNSALGLEPTITLIQQRIKRIHGVLRYLIATIMGVMQKPVWQAEIKWDEGEYTGPITLITVGNNPLTGGMFYVTPHADPFDGLLTFVYGYMPTRLKILRMLPKLMKSGKGNYVEHPDIHEVHTKWIKIKANPPTPLHADGEIQSDGIADIEYKIVPKCLPILLN
jgi:diacylglycerol kinase (ATP)